MEPVSAYQITLVRSCGNGAFAFPFTPANPIELALTVKAIVESNDGSEWQAIVNPVPQNKRSITQAILSSSSLSSISFNAVVALGDLLAGDEAGDYAIECNGGEVMVIMAGKPGDGSTVISWEDFNTEADYDNEESW